MGSFSYITFDDYPILSAKNGYYHEICDLIFLSSDFVSESRPFSSHSELFWGDTFKDDIGSYQFEGFRQTTKICKQRLEIYGHSIVKAKKDFYHAKKVFREESHDNCNYEILSKTTFKQYIDTIKDILISKEKKHDATPLTLKDILIEDDLILYEQSISDHLYIILSLLPEDSIIEYNLSDVIGYINERELLHDAIEKIIILTEGKTDVEFISKTIERLYPHISPYYHFINFDEYKVESSASALAKFVTSLIASNIQHPIIAIFDNDTAGIMEMNKLNSIKTPNNFRVLKYPNLKLAKKYPTLGPTGFKKMDVNGYACSIEMYFGKDILAKGDELAPVIWKGYNEKEKKYQGEIADKRNIQKAFREKLKSNDGDFKDMDLILQEIFLAFKKN